MFALLKPTFSLPLRLISRLAPDLEANAERSPTDVFYIPQLRQIA